MFQIGRLRILTTRGSGRAVRWYGMSVGYETTWLSAWKKEVKSRIVCRQKVAIRLMVRECATIIVLGIALGQIIRLIVGV